LTTSPLLSSVPAPAREVSPPPEKRTSPPGSPRHVPPPPRCLPRILLASSSCSCASDRVMDHAGSQAVRVRA
jgi:hypothetical protein